MNTATHYCLAGMGLGQSNSQQQQQQQMPSAAVIAQGAATGAAQIINGNYVGGIGTELMTAATIPSPAQPFLAVAGAAAEISA